MLTYIRIREEDYIPTYKDFIYIVPGIMLVLTYYANKKSKEIII
jgi:hypothetical protein